MIDQLRYRTEREQEDPLEAVGFGVRKAGGVIVAACDRDTVCEVGKRLCGRYVSCVFSSEREAVRYWQHNSAGWMFAHSDDEQIVMLRIEAHGAINVYASGYVRAEYITPVEVFEELIEEE